MSLTDLKHSAEEWQAKHRLAQELVKVERSARATAKQNLQDALEAQQIVQAVAQKVQEQAHSRIASVVTRCLAAVFGEEAQEFRIVFERKRGKTEARLTFVKDGHEVHPTKASSVGQVDVAAFALRLSCLLLAPHARRLIVCDEPFGNLNGEQYQSKMEGLLTSLAEEMNVQMVISSDDDWLQIGKVIRLG